MDPHQTLLTARTCFLQMIYSDDDGETWSGPFNLNQDVKEEWMSFCGTSPGTGVQLRSGRLVAVRTEAGGSQSWNTPTSRSQGPMLAPRR